MRFSLADTDKEVLCKLGRRIAALRLSMNLTQQELALKAGISKRSLERLEQGTGNTNLMAFIAICMALRRVPGFEQLLPEVELTPQQILAHKKLRKRASGISRKPVARWGRPG